MDQQQIQKFQYQQQISINPNQQSILSKLKILHCQIITICLWFGMGYSAYLLFSSLLGNKKSIIILILTNIFHRMCVKKSDKLINFIMKSQPMRWFDKFEVIIEDEPLSLEKTMYSYGPHSIWPISLVYLVHMDINPFKNCKYLVAEQFIKYAPHGILAKLWGVDSVGAKSMQKIMTDGYNILLCPGGFEEATITSNKEYRFFITKRKGFIKYALKFGYKIRPVFCFNENKLYITSDFMLKHRIKINKFKLPSALFYSKYGGILPNPFLSIYLVIGKAIDIPHISKPSKEDINKYHKIYMQSVRDLFNRFVDKCDPGAKLVFDNELFSAKL